MTYEIRKVANGVIVLPGGHYARAGSVTDNADIHVFKTWGQASWWIAQQLKGQEKQQ